MRSNRSTLVVLLYVGAFLCVALTSALPAAVHAQVGLARSVALRCVAATVALRVEDASGNTSTGSGVLIDERGYLLTNFHVVGSLVPTEQTAAGELYAADGTVLVSHAQDDRSEARPRWRAKVVRGDVRLDMALLRITANADGSPLAPDSVFPHIAPGSTAALSVGAPVFAFGFPLDARTPNVTGGHVEGFQSNADGALAWIRTDAEFNPGNSGGLLADQEGHFLAMPTRVRSHGNHISPVEYARPVERLPPAFRAAIASGAEDTVVFGVVALQQEAVVTFHMNGDALPDNRVDELVLAVPAGAHTVIIEPAMPLRLMLGDRVLREGNGEIVVQPADSPNAAVIAVVDLSSPEGARAIDVAIRFEPVLLAALGSNDEPAVSGVLGTLGPGDGTVFGGGLGLRLPGTQVGERLPPVEVTPETEAEPLPVALVGISLFGGLNFDAGSFGFHSTVNAEGIVSITGDMDPGHFGLMFGVDLTLGTGPHGDLMANVSLPLGASVDLGIPTAHLHLELDYLPGITEMASEDRPGVDVSFRGYRAGIGVLSTNGYGAMLRYVEQIRDSFPVYRTLTLSFQLVISS